MLAAVVDGLPVADEAVSGDGDLHVVGLTVAVIRLTIWSMGAVVSIVVDEMDMCDNRLLFQGRIDNGPEDTRWIAQEKDTGA